MPRPSTIALWKSQGRCPNCGRVPTAPYRVCAVCRASRKAASARLRVERLASNRCPRCGDGMVAWQDSPRRYRHCLACRKAGGRNWRRWYQRRQAATA